VCCIDTNVALNCWGRALAIGEFWNVSADSPKRPEVIPGAAPAADAGPGETNGPGPEPAAPERRARLSLAKLLPSEAKHRGAGRRATSDRNAGIGLDELDDVDEALRRRNDILASAIKRTQDLYVVTDQRHVFRLAAADVFVEKAQLVLAQRARVMWRAGIVSTVSAVALLIGLSAFVVWRAEAISSTSIAANLLILGIVEMATAAIIVFVGVRYLLTLSRAFFRENVAVVARQHGLGFGRLYVYTNPDAVRLRDLQDAFGLDLESTPIFLDVKSKETADTIYSKVTQDLGLSSPPGR
jgi:hypothetical protein